MIWCGMFRNFIFFLEYMHLELKEDLVVLNGRNAVVVCWFHRELPPSGFGIDTRTPARVGESSGRRMKSIRTFLHPRYRIGIFHRLWLRRSESLSTLPKGSRCRSLREDDRPDGSQDERVSIQDCGRKSMS